VVLSVGRYWKPVLTVLVILLLWQGAMQVKIFPRMLVAAPSDIASYMASHAGLLISSSLTTLREVAIGFSFALMAQVRAVSESLMPILIVTQVIPSIAIAPLLVLVLGLGEAPKIAMATIISFFPIVVNTGAGLQSLSAEMRDLGRSYNASKYQMLLYLALPNALPYVFTGIRIGITLSVIGAVVGEFVSADSGLGYLVLQGNATVNPSMIFSSIVCLAILGVSLFGLATLAEYLAVPWARRVT